MSPKWSQSFNVAAGLFLVAAFVYLILIVLAIPSGHLYPISLGSSKPVPLAVVMAIYGTLIAFAALMAREILAGRIGRRLIAGFLAWAVATLFAAILITPLAAAGIALTALVPLALIWYGVRTTR